ncbi:hypothetical protein LguiB_023283 [Lonicera macranthoides]
MADVMSLHCQRSQRMEENSQSSNNRAQTSTSKLLCNKLSELDREAGFGKQDVGFRGNVREAISLSRNSPPAPHPLCSICQHKAPVFGKPPRWFTYVELELATGGFSKAHSLAEGGFGSVHRGVLSDGQAVAVKQQVLKGIKNFAQKWKSLAVLNTEMS